MMKTKDIAFAYKTSVKFRYPNLMCTNEQPLLITGKSGCGKSTLLHITAGLIQNYNGEIWIDNKPIHTFTAKEMDVFRGKHIGIVYQKPHFVASLSIVENIELASFLGSGKRNKTYSKPFAA
jgi:ABC-type lipoprotein export system ATPase subunit